MPTSENEEFEFRLRAEKERAKAPPATAAPDTSILGSARTAADTVLEPAAAMLTGGAAGIVGPIVGAGKEALTRDFGHGTAEKTAADIAQAITYQPRNPSAQEAMSTIGKMFDKSKLAGLGPSEQLALGSMAPAASKAAGGVAKAESDLLRQGVSKLGTAMTPKLKPETAALAQKAHEMGIKVPLDALTDNNVLKVFGKAVREIPLSGASTEANRVAFNQAILKTIGGDVREKKITPAVFNTAMEKSGKQIGAISARHPIVVGQSLEPAVGAMMRDMAKETPDVARVIAGYVDDITSKIENGKIAGETFRKLRSELTSQLRTTTNGDLKRALSTLDEHMLDAIEANLSPAELKEFTTARQNYYNGKVIEPLVAKAAVKGGGDMSPAAYANALAGSPSRKTAIAKGRGGEPVDISAVGSKFLTEPGSSNTSEKALAYSLLGGGAGLAAAPGAGGIWSAANLYNRLGPRLAKKIVEKQK